MSKKRIGSKLVSNRHRSIVDSLPHDVVALILEKLPVKPLLRLRSVSKLWKSTIESRPFMERQLINRRQSQGPDVLMVRLNYYRDDGRNPDSRKIVLGSSTQVCTATFPVSGSMFCYDSCDGLVCVYCIYKPSVVVNPLTRWHRTFHLSYCQQLHIQKYERKEFELPSPKLGFGKDTVKGTFKPVWLYNSSEFGLDNATTCEVFDFSTNAWRFVVPTSPYRINAHHKPVYLDGSLYWFTECKEPEVLSFNLHTETFQVVCKAPFAYRCDPLQLTMCVLHDRLCVSEKKWPTQVIWSFDSSGSGNKTWKKLCSIDLTLTLSWFKKPALALSPIAILEKKRLLLQGPDWVEPLVTYNLRSKCYKLLYKPTKPRAPVSYFQSLFTVV
ncbi:PREDICTED: F-box protein At1g11270-like [Camelina sativa]|uniref:F-box protein At1g11270-like n=1 Tax=Camelina sativa TaxID=90675 RepID=A0ABM0XS23_CAMSA|nr:PREDICTED: F-box protein At1g11270-like [Camelina sativa]